MAFCSRCGKPLQENMRFCPGCGAPVQPAASQYTAQPGVDIGEKFESFTDTPDTTPFFDPYDIQVNKGMAVLAYLSWLVLIPLFAAKNSPFARFHTNQGLVLAIAEIVWGVAQSVVTTIARMAFAHWIPALSTLISVLAGLLNLVFIVLLIIGIVNAANGKAKELPLIGKIRILK